MKSMDISKLNTDNRFEIILELIKLNKGYVTSRLVTDLGIHRYYLRIMLDRGLIKKAITGVYMGKNTIEDKFYTFQLRYPKIIFSGFTGLRFYNLTQLEFENFDFTVDKNYHAEKVIKKRVVTKCKKELLNLGAHIVKTDLGNKIKIYDRERIICDVIRYKDRFDLKEVEKAVQNYLKDENRNIDRLKEYAKKLNSYKMVMKYIGME